MKKLALAAAILAASTSAMAAESNIWSTTFDSGNEFEQLGPFPWSTLSFTYGGGSTASAASLPGFGTQYFHNDTSGTTVFGAYGLGGHSALHLKFDIVYQDSWDSTNGSPAPDILFVNFDGSSYQWTVNSASGSVFDVGPGTVISSGSNLVGSYWNDTVVRYDFLIPHSASTFGLAINFGGAGFQGGTDESWGIDNFALSAIYDASGGVPEPATWAMLIAGFGMVGGALRARRRLVA